MSGVEIAGFVLAGFPLLISAAEHYKEGFEPLLKWKRFRTDFIGFIDAVDIEKQLFHQMLERFLISADVPHEELQSFMTMPNYEGWQRKDLVNMLQTRLGTSYAVFLSTIKTMNKLMEDLQALLSLNDGKVDWSNDGASRWDYQFKRIHLSFTKKGAKTIASLEIHNRKLRELLDSNDKLDSMKATRKDTTLATVFECIRRHASSLHTALKKGWNCDCEVPHPAALRLQHRATGGWSSSFNMAFTTSHEFMMEATARREVIITIKKDSKDEAKPATTELHHPTPKEEYLSTLRRNFESQPTSQIKSISCPLLPCSDSASSTSSQSAFRDFFTKSDPGKGMLSVSSTNGTELLLDEDQSRGWFSGRKAKPKKSVRVDLPLEIPIRQQPQCASMTAVVKESPCVPDVQIKDLCSTLFARDVDCPYLGYLPDDQDRCHEFRSIKAGLPGSANERITSLDALLAGQSDLMLSRHERYKIASVLASSLLQLQTTPWLAHKLEKKNIFFFVQGSKVLVEQPYIRHSFSSTKTSRPPSESPTPTPANRFAVRNSLNTLGILLLELCFGQSIEDQEIRKCYLGPDGKPHAGTDYMTARDWAEMVCEEEPALESIIKCCVFCAFEEKADWDNKRFTQAVYASVVDPLEKIIRKWPVS